MSTIFVSVSYYDDLSFLKQLNNNRDSDGDYSSDEGPPPPNVMLSLKDAAWFSEPHDSPHADFVSSLTLNR